MTEGPPPNDSDGPRNPALEDTTMLRWFFALPEPLPLPNGWSWTERIANKPDDGVVDDPMVTVIFWQISSEHGRIHGTAQAIFDVISRTPGVTPNSIEPLSSQADSRGPTTNYTVVEAFTASESPDGRPDDWTGLGADLPPRADPFNRCLRLVNDLARAYRVTCRTPYGLPTYERIPQPIFLYTAPAHREWVSDDQDSTKSNWIEYLHIVDSWSGPSMFFLDHINTADMVSGPIIDDDRIEEFIYWLAEIRRGFPFIAWRERLLEAYRALYIHGEYAQAVILAQTACEVFLDTILLLLCWEENIEPSSAVELLEEGKLTRRIKTEMQPRLGGNWQLDGPGEVARWFHNTALLRNRVVHGGYLPSHQEAEKAYNTALPLEKFTFSRLVEKRNKYPRVTLMTIAQSGLQRRGLWRGKIKHFAEEIAPNETDWRQQIRDYQIKLGYR